MGSLSFASEKSEVRERPERRRRVRTGGQPRYGEVNSDGSSKAGCREPDTGLIFARNVESPSDSDSPDGIRRHETHNSKGVPAAMIEIASSTTSQKDVTAE